MARESKRTREEKRFGRPGRLSDRIISGEWDDKLGIDTWMCDESYWNKRIIESHLSLKDFLGNCVIVDARNVSDYCFVHLGEEKAAEIPPSCRIPFVKMFFEFKRPPALLSSGGYIDNTGINSEWGVSVELCKTYPNNLVNPNRVSDHYGHILAKECIRDDYLFFLSVGVARVGWLSGSSVFCPPVIEMRFILKKNLEPSGFMIYEDSTTTDDAILFKNYKGRLIQLVNPMFFALSFMNCKNVRVNAVEPDAKVNRERRKAKLNPFVRYHTIDIEPMKRVLTTEGGIATNGLKKALHICRGHFARYTDTFLGRKLDQPVTVWRPSHVRGSAKEGVVFSDYRVHAPKGEA